MPLSKKQTALLDRFGSLQSAVELFRSTTEKDYKAALAEIQGWYEASPADQRYPIETTKYTVIVHPCKTECRITDRAKLKEALAHRFDLVWTVTLESVRRWTTPEQQREFIEDGPTGFRKVEAIPK